MNKLFIAILFLIFSQEIFSQKISVTYYDSAWLLTSKDFAEYYRVGLIDTVNYQYFGEVKDYYKSGKLQMKGKFQANAKQDTFYFYYPSGELKTKGFYQNNIRYGFWTNYHENGKIKDRIAFNGSFICALENYDESGSPKMINGTGNWGTEYYFDLVREKIKVEGAYRDTLRHGTWNFYQTSLIPGIKGRSNVTRLECTEEYDNGIFVKGKYYSGGGNIQDIGVPTMKIFPETIKFKNLETWKASKYASIEAYPYLKFLPKLDSTQLPVDQFAEFPNGIDSLTNFFRSEMKFSKSYIKSQKGRGFMLIIVITESGKLEIIQNPSKSSLNMYPTNQTYYNKAMKAVKKLPQWKPALRNNKKVKNYFMLAIDMDDGIIDTQLLSKNELTHYNKTYE